MPWNSRTLWEPCVPEVTSLYLLNFHSLKFADDGEEEVMFQKQQSNGAQCSTGDDVPVLFICKVCKNSFSSRDPLQKHMQDIHEIRARCRVTVVCNECNAEISGLGKLVDHYKIHHVGKKPLQCNDCGKKFAELRGYQDHGKKWKCQAKLGTLTRLPDACTDNEKIDSKLGARDSVGQGRTRTCPNCKQKFNNRDDHILHLRSCGRAREPLFSGDPSEAIKCKHCEEDTYFRSLSAFDKHYNTFHPGEKRFKCKYCTKDFRSRKQWRAHGKCCPAALNSGQSATIKCKHCQEDTYFRSLTAYDEHYNAFHPGAKRFKCKYCPKDFCSMKQWRVHSNGCERSLNVSQTECPECKKTFKHRSLFELHYKRAHASARPYECSACHKKFQTFQGLKRHGDCKKKPCRVCGATLSSRAMAEHFWLNHPDLKPFKCDECGMESGNGLSMINHIGKSCVNREALNQHEMNTHNKKFKCILCQMVFADRLKLEDHMTQHTGQKTHLCPACGKGFAIRGNLKSHMRVHRDKKPYLCSECPKTFRHVNSLRIHLLNHSGRMPFVCNICDEDFACKKHLKNHLEGKHWQIFIIGGLTEHYYSCADKMNASIHELSQPAAF